MNKSKIEFNRKRTLERDLGFKPEIDLRTGLRKFSEWYKEYYK